MIEEATGKELRIIEYLAALDAKIADGERYIKPRLCGIKNGWRQMRLMHYVCGWLIARLYDTLPRKTLLHMLRISEFGEVVVRLKQAAAGAQQVCVEQDDMIVIVNAAMSGQCALCMGDAETAKGCKLCAALWQVCPPEDATYKACPFRDAAMKGLNK